MPLSGSEAVGAEAVEQIENNSSVNQATDELEPIAEAVFPPPAVENRDCAGLAAKAPKPPKVASEWEPATLGTLDALGGAPLDFRKLEEAESAAPLAEDPSERATTLEVSADAPRRWAEGYAALCAMPPPSGFSPERWRRVV